MAGDVPRQDAIQTLYCDLKEAYMTHMRPLEEHYNFPFFFSPVLNAADIEANPFVLLVGQYSVGKTSFINHLLRSPTGYPGCNIGPEPTTDRFVAITHGEEERVLPGNMAAAMSEDKPFAGLAKFGNDFLSKFSCVEMQAEILKGVTLVDTPGVLSGEKQRIGRNYDMAAVCEWFAERSDIIVLLFDAHKLDISDELKDVLEGLHCHAEKIRIVLNKSDQVSPKQLMRVHGALMWQLGKVFQSPEVCRVYISSFWDRPYAHPGGQNAWLFDSEKEELYKDLLDIPRYAAIRRVNELIKRARLALAHGLVCATLRTMMPTLWGKEQKQRDLIANIDVVFDAVALEHGLARGDLPSAGSYRKKLEAWTRAGKSLSAMPALDRVKVDALGRCLQDAMPALLAPLSQDIREWEKQKPAESIAFETRQSGANEAEDCSAGSVSMMPGVLAPEASAWAHARSHARSSGGVRGGRGGRRGVGDVRCGSAREIGVHGGQKSEPGATVRGGEVQYEAERRALLSKGDGAARGWHRGREDRWQQPATGVRKTDGGESGMAFRSLGFSHRVRAPAPQHTEAPSSVACPEQAKARSVVQGYTASARGELSLTPGQKVMVLDEDSSGWCRGLCLASGSEGWFPLTYIADA